MIYLEQAISVLKTAEYLNTYRQVTAIKRNITNDLSGCKSFTYTCDCSIPVVADLSATNTNFNDFSSFYYDDIGIKETVVATLTNLDTNTSVIITDNTYGSFYDTGVLKAWAWGFKLDWRLVAAALGFGNYKMNIKIDGLLFRGDFEENYCYNLMQFSCESANGTIRIETQKEGYIQNGKDYSNLSIGEWTNQIRLYGEISLEEPITTVDNYISNPKTKTQVQVQIVDNYNLTVNNIDNQVVGNFIKDDLLANNIIITDYNKSNVGDYLGVETALLSIDTPIAHEINGTWTYQIKLEDRVQTTLKRNF